VAKNAEAALSRVPLRYAKQVLFASITTLNFFSIPFVAPLPAFVAQQNTESSPHFSQTCFTSPLPQPGARRQRHDAERRGAALPPSAGSRQLRWFSALRRALKEIDGCAALAAQPSV